MASAETRGADVPSAPEVKRALHPRNENASAELRRKYVQGLRKAAGIHYFVRTAIERLTGELEFRREGERVVPLPTLVSRKTAEYTQKNLKEVTDISNIKEDIQHLVPPWLVNQLLNIRLGIFEGIVRPKELPTAPRPTSPFLIITDVSLRGITSPLEPPPQPTAPPPSPKIAPPPFPPPPLSTSEETSKEAEPRELPSPAPQPTNRNGAIKKNQHAQPLHRKKKPHPKASMAPPTPTQDLSIAPARRKKNKLTLAQRKFARERRRSRNGDLEELTQQPVEQEPPHSTIVRKYLHRKHLWTSEEVDEILRYAEIKVLDRGRDWKVGREGATHTLPGAAVKAVEFLNFTILQIVLKLGNTDTLYAWIKEQQ